MSARSLELRAVTLDRVGLGVLQLLDAVRREVLRVLFCVRPIRQIFAAPTLRIPLASLLSVLCAAALATTAPLVSLWLGAALMGVPHVISGIRHAALLRRRTRWTQAAALCGAGIGVIQLLGGGELTYAAFALLTAASSATELWAARPPLRRAVPLAALCLLYAVLGCWFPLGFLLVASHLHGLSAVAVFAVRARSRGVTPWPMLLALTALTVGALCGLFDTVFPARLWAPHSASASIILEATGAAIQRHPSAVWLRRMLFIYALGQSVHFMVWLRLMPELDRPAKVPQTWRRAWTLFRADFGRYALPALVLCLVATPLLLFGGGAAREAYFALTYFHVGLEAAALMGMLSES